MIIGCMLRVYNVKREKTKNTNVTWLKPRSFMDVDINKSMIGKRFHIYKEKQKSPLSIF